MSFCKKLCLISMFLLSSIPLNTHCRHRSSNRGHHHTKSYRSKAMIYTAKDLAFVNAMNAVEDAFIKNDIEKLNIQLTVAKKTLTNGANINIKDGVGATALLRAAYNNNLPAVTFLLENKADPKLSKDQDGSTPLSWATQHKNQEMIDKLKHYIK